ncbi:MAG: malonyl-[acyl-carrier protein] O-methyltransferase BioC [Gammaproteobacteria bacterium]|nr:MAG: malonyl-[acyl-carrier protein] O-methyltransferase BioC [Gammaproteobacteria bacterium]
MKGDFSIDKRQARRTFGRAAAGYDEAAVLQHEIADRMLQRLDYVRLQPRRILDIGCGTGRASEALLRRYPRAEVVALDFALPMLEQARRRSRWRRRPRCLCGDMDSLPLAAQSFDLVFSNAAIQWSADPAGAIAEMHRVLRPGGLLMFSSFGPDTLHELRTAWAKVDGTPHVHGFIDLHDYGDMLVAAGLADPVMDMERLTLTYADTDALMRDLKAIGANNAASGRTRGLTGRARLQALRAAYERFRDASGRLPATYEVVYGHAWGAEQRREGGAVLVSPDSLRRR